MTPIKKKLFKKTVLKPTLMTPIKKKKTFKKQSKNDANDAD